MRTTGKILLTTAALSMAAACGSEDPNNNNGNNNTDGIVEVSGELTADTTWKADTTYILTELVFVRAPATLTIEAGTTIQGDNGAALIITRGAKIDARGTASKPIVMTSSAKVGERRSGDWGGVVLLGAAPINLAAGENKIEGIEATDARSSYGGTDAAHNCGVLQYVRIEFAGYELSIDNELNGLTVGACGSATRLEQIQVHQGKDDGIEFFGGTANLKWAVLSGNHDDSLDWDQGYSGKIQFLVIQQDPSDADAAFEADNLNSDNDAMPRSSPTIYNATLIGTNDAAGSQRGMVLRRGTWGILKNFIVMGFPSTGVDIRDTSGPMGMMQTPPMLTVENSIFFDNGSGGAAHFDTDGSEDDDGGFDEAAFLSDAARGNRMGIDPMLAAPFNLTAPGFVPAAGSPAATGAATPTDAFFTAGAAYLGAFEPGGADWTAGWTAFPAN